MSQTSLTVKQVRALLMIASKKDNGRMLNGVLIDFDKGRAVATDGHCCLAINIDCDAGDNVIISRDDLEIIARAGKATDVISIEFTWDDTGDVAIVLSRPGRASVNSVAMSGQYPNYERIIPDPSGENANFDPQLVARMDKALQLAVDAERFSYVTHNGAAGALMHIKGYASKAIGVVMPARIESEDAPLAAFGILHSRCGYDD